MKLNQCLVSSQRLNISKIFPLCVVMQTHGIFKISICFLGGGFSMLLLSLKYAYSFYFPTCIQVNYFGNLAVCQLYGFYVDWLVSIEILKQYLLKVRFTQGSQGVLGRVCCAYTEYNIGRGCNISSTGVMLSETTVSLPQVYPSGKIFPGEQYTNGCCPASFVVSSNYLGLLNTGKVAKVALI